MTRLLIDYPALLEAERQKLRNYRKVADGEIKTLRNALVAVVAEPYGCRFCDSGKLRKPNDPAKDHDDDCPFVLARTALGLRCGYCSHAAHPTPPEGEGCGCYDPEGVCSQNPMASCFNHGFYDFNLPECPHPDHKKP